MRLDSYLVEIGNLGSRGRAKRSITEGYVKVNGRVVTKPRLTLRTQIMLKYREDWINPQVTGNLKRYRKRPAS